KFGLRASPLARRLALMQRVARGVARSFPAVKRAAVRNAGALYQAPSFSVASAQASLESSLRALRTDYADLFLAHEASAEALPGDDNLEWLERLRSAGRILAYGVATDFDRIVPVVQHRPALCQVVQFDSDLSRASLVALQPRAEQLVITYGLLQRSLALCRSRLAAAAATHASARALARLDDEALCGLLLR